MPVKASIKYFWKNALIGLGVVTAESVTVIAILSVSVAIKSRLKKLDIVA
jgi:intein-encoded DNA endonuclease-like protein